MKEDTFIKLNYWAILISSLLVSNCSDNIQLYSDIYNYENLSDVSSQEQSYDIYFIDVITYDKKGEWNTFLCSTSDYIHISPDKEGNLLLNKEIYEVGKGRHIYKLNKFNEVIWSYFYWIDDSKYESIYINKIIQIKDGSYMVLCTAKRKVNWEENYDFNDLCLLKLKNNGVLDWSKFYKVYGDDIGETIEELDDGYLIVGQINKPTSNKFPAIWLIKIDLNGSIVWQKLYEIDYLNYVKSIIKTSDKKFTILAQIKEKISASLLIKINERGDIEWAKEYRMENDTEVTNILNHDKNDYSVGVHIINKDTYNCYGYFGLLTIGEDGNLLSGFKYSFFDKSNKAVFLTLDSFVYIGDGYILSGGNSKGYFAILNVDNQGNIVWSLSKDNSPETKFFNNNYNNNCSYSFGYGDYKIIPIQKDYFILKNIEYLSAYGKGCSSFHINSFIKKFSRDGYFCNTRIPNELTVIKEAEPITTFNKQVNTRYIFISPSEGNINFKKLDKDFITCELCQ